MTRSISLIAGKRLALVASLAIALSTIPAAFASQVFITGWVPGLGGGGNNIYTNLVQEFPNTGSGTPGSGIGQDNASFLYEPSSYTAAGIIPAGNNVTNGINFTLASNGTGQDFAQVGTGGGSINPLVINTVDGSNALDVADATAVYLLTAAYNGTSYSVTFSGTDGASDTFTGVSAPDFCNGGGLNTTSGGALDQSVLEVNDHGACGTGNSSGSVEDYYLYEQAFTLNSSFNGQALTGISISDTANTLLVLGITATDAASSSAPEPSSVALLGIGLAGLRIFGRRRAVA